MSQEQQEPTPDVVEPATENIEAVEATDDASAEVEVDLTEETPDGYEDADPLEAFRAELRRQEGD